MRSGLELFFDQADSAQNLIQPPLSLPQLLLLDVAAATIRKTTHEERVLSAKPCLSLLLSAPFETQCRVRRQGEINEEQCYPY